MKTRLTAVLNGRMVWLVTITFSLFVLFPPQVQATLIESRTSDGQTLSERTTDLASVRSMLENELVVQRLVDYGYSKEAAQAKIENATDAQLHQLASLSEDLAAGGDGLGVVVTVLVIVLLVVVIMKLADRQVIIR